MKPKLTLISSPSSRLRLRPAVRSQAHPTALDYESFIFALNSICTLYPHTSFFKGYNKPVKVDLHSQPSFYAEENFGEERT